MYKVKTKYGSIIFGTIEDAIMWIVSRSEKLFVDGSFVKIYFMEDVM